MSPAASLFAKSVMRRDAVHDIPLPQFPWIPHLIRHEVMHVPSGLWQQDEPDDMSPRTCTTRKTTSTRRKPTQRCCLSACKHVIAFYPLNHPVMHGHVDFLSFLLVSHFGPRSNIWQSRDVIDFFSPSVFILYLNPLFAFHIHWLHSLFPLLSMHEADSKGSPEIHNPPTGEKWMALMI